MRFLASLFFKSTIRDHGSAAPREGVWEEVIVLVISHTESGALARAEQLGVERSGVTYSSDSGEVTWTYVKVERVVPMEDGELIDGQELFSRYLRSSEARSILEPLD
ncbi:DUF4288 domain-containing protein [Ralstonia solanacearum]|uniref:DUF4288 domain-containing protein n=1 Tax=Ralstonia solanacearum K60 TaxID=1091042 RepID=A0AAP7ZM69_RALSL|nr:DUF4288 domain-containing protein [Ralstonia solanacearum]OYQ12939.1 hypothetical protein B7R77_06520 [Ralstonia solanacearum K60]RIJ87275.1 DUF4288 domain-containing protein [Ralstonia solanacearum]CCF97720.1 hypothetical protein RSK60_2420001 [Ralstonia solanacearum K60]